MLTGALGVVLMGAASFVAVPPAQAKGKLDKILELAKSDADAARFEEAARNLGRAAAFAQRKGDLEGADRVAREVDSLFQSSFGVSGRGVATQGAAAPRDQHRTLMIALMGELDPARSSAFVSARTLATELLYAATKKGDHEQIAEAVAVLHLHAKRRKSGAAAPLLAEYADGLVALAAKKPAEATAPLRRALDGAALNGWLEMSTYVGVELAAAWIELEDPDQAGAAIKTVADLLTDEPDALFRRAAGTLLASRLKGAPDSILQPLKDAIAPDGAQQLRAGIPTGTTGGDLGLGKAKNTKVGRALSKWSKSKPLVTAARELPGIAVALHFLDDWKRVIPVQERLVRPGDGGLKLAIRGAAVGLQHVDVENEMSQGLGRGQLVVGGGNGIQMSRARAMYLVGMGETWSLSKTGEVTIGR